VSDANPYGAQKDQNQNGKEQRWWTHFYLYLKWLENVCWLWKAQSCYMQRSLLITIHGPNAWVFYCFLDGYNYIVINLEDREKAALTCPFDIYTYRKMPFGLCNAPKTFQRYIMNIVFYYVKRIIEVFINDFMVYMVILSHTFQLSTTNTPLPPTTISTQLH
jgi:hypothetical protein